MIFMVKHNPKHHKRHLYYLEYKGSNKVYDKEKNKIPSPIPKRVNHGPPPTPTKLYIPMNFGKGRKKSLMSLIGSNKKSSNKLPGFILP